ncbi:hypothetical protein SLEP1_g57537 [Rubroshorea leprosula]|uniref:Uncharacterized protein n=1 Tax=Rubroshorea leprosula TaxID=152421 RepID=A0AAV5MMS8_9ROSI|nr:hypothetical protein SLEP1_g57537 [Rubroshorea leprosula]
MPSLELNCSSVVRTFSTLPLLSVGCKSTTGVVFDSSTESLAVNSFGLALRFDGFANATLATFLFSAEMQNLPQKHLPQKKQKFPLDFDLESQYSLLPYRRSHL